MAMELLGGEAPPEITRDYAEIAETELLGGEAPDYPRLPEITPRLPRWRCWAERRPHRVPPPRPVISVWARAFFFRRGMKLLGGRGRFFLLPPSISFLGGNRSSCAAAMSFFSHARFLF